MKSITSCAASFQQLLTNKEQEKLFTKLLADKSSTKSKSQTSLTDKHDNFYQNLTSFLQTTYQSLTSLRVVASNDKLATSEEQVTAQDVNQTTFDDLNYLPECNFTGEVKARIEDIGKKQLHAGLWSFADNKLALTILEAFGEVGDSNKVDDYSSYFDEYFTNYFANYVQDNVKSLPTLQSWKLLQEKLSQELSSLLESTVTNLLAIDWHDSFAQEFFASDDYLHLNGLAQLLIVQACRIQAKLRNFKVIFTNGCFDILHKGHVNYLNQARQLGQMLIVAVNTDSSVKRLKGPTRPINGTYERSQMLANLKAVSCVVPFEQDTPLEVIESLLPDVLVKGGDYEVKSIVGYQQVIANGGQVLTLPFQDGYSTTNIIKKIQDK